MLKRVPNFQIGLILLCLILQTFSTMAIIVVNNDTDVKTSIMLSVRKLGSSMAECFANVEKLKCFERHFMKALDAAILDNSTWCYSDFLSIEKHTIQSDRKLLNMSIGRSLNAEVAEDNETIGAKLMNLFKRRSLRLQLPKFVTSSSQLMRLGAGISDAIDDFSIAGITDEGTKRVLNGFIDDKIELFDTIVKGVKKKIKKKLKTKKKIKKNKITNINNINPIKGRKKKDKDKNMAMMGGMAMMAMLAQMFFGKVLLIAGAAFVMAKIALLVSVLGSLKKGSSGSSGSTEHIIVSGGGGGHSSHGHSHESSGWHRSMPYYYPTIETVSVEHDSYAPHSPPVHSTGGGSHDSSPSPLHDSHDHHHTSNEPIYYAHDHDEATADHDEDHAEFKRRKTSGFL